MKQNLDDMQVYFEGSGVYDPAYFKVLEKCMRKFNDTETHKSQNAAWAGMGTYWSTNGTDHDYMDRADHWGSCRPDAKDTRCKVGYYLEYLWDTAGGEFGEQGMEVFEPCNYASNVAFYHGTTRICDYPEFSIDEGS